MGAFEYIQERAYREPSFFAAYETKAEKIEQCGEEMLKTVTSLRAKGWRTHEPIWNACLYTNTAALDHTCYFTDLLRERSSWRRGLAVRSLAVLIFEVCDDLPSVFGKDFRRCVRRLSAEGKELQQLNCSLKAISVFRNTNAARMNEIRNIAGAHRDHDALLMHRTLEDIDLMAFYQLSLEFGEILNAVGPPAQALMTQTSQQPPPELSSY